MRFRKWLKNEWKLDLYYQKACNSIFMCVFTSIKRLVSRESQSSIQVFPCCLFWCCGGRQYLLHILYRWGAKRSIHIIYLISIDPPLRNSSMSSNGEITLPHVLTFNFSLHTPHLVINKHLKTSWRRCQRSAAKPGFTLSRSSGVTSPFQLWIGKISLIEILVTQTRNAMPILLPTYTPPSQQATHLRKVQKRVLFLLEETCGSSGEKLQAWFRQP